jgi:hypothetical protein
MTTKYHATESLFGIYREDHDLPLGIVGTTYLSAAPIPYELPMSTTMTVWADSRGEILQASTTENANLTASQSTDGLANTVSQTSTTSVSDFNVKFHVTPPRASQVKTITLSSPTTIDGMVTITLKCGKNSAASGLLIVQPLGNDVSTAINTTIDHDSYAWVNPSGSYSDRISINAHFSAPSYRLSATLFEGPNTKLTCTAGPSSIFAVGKTTSGIDLLCAK